MLRSEKFNDFSALQVGILDNGREGNYYAATISITRLPRTAHEDAITEAYLNSNGIPFFPGLLSQGGLKANACVILHSKLTLPTDIIFTFLNQAFPAGIPNLEHHRCMLIPLGKNQHAEASYGSQLAQINDDLRRYTFTYYDYQHMPTPTMTLRGKIALPNPERYCDFQEGEVFSPEEELTLMASRTKATLAVSHGKPVVSRFSVKMVEMVSPTPVTEVSYKKQTGEMVTLPIAKFEAKVARARKLPNFTFSSRIRITQLLQDFNQGDLPAPAWSFSFGPPLALSVQHDFHYLSHPQHPDLKRVNPKYHASVDELMHPMPSVYFAYIGALQAYGVYAAENLPAMTCIDIYAGDFMDDHPNSEADCYCYRPQIPGYQYSYSQGIYAYESGNTTTLINSAEHLNDQKNTRPGLKANIGAYIHIYKKTPLPVYYTLEPIAKDTQLLINYEDLVQTECPRHFTFFGKGATVCATEDTPAFLKEDVSQGQAHYKKGEYFEAKKSFRCAYHLAKACYEQFPQAKAAQMRLTFASVCEYLSDAYRQLKNQDKAVKYLAEAVALRQSLPKQTAATAERLKSTIAKLERVRECRLVKK